MALRPLGTKDGPVGMRKRDNVGKTWDEEPLGFVTPCRG